MDALDEFLALCCSANPHLTRAAEVLIWGF